MIEQLVSLSRQKEKDITLKAWKSLKAFGLVQMGYASAVYDNKCYIFGGRIYPGTGSRKLSYVFDGVNAVAIASLPVNLFNHRSIVVGNRILIFGGIFSLTANNENMDMYWYDPATDTYTKEGTIPIPMIAFGAVKLGNYIYAYGGGLNSSGFRQNTKMFYRYDITAKTWTKLTYHNGADVAACNLLTYDGKIYTTGGTADDNISVFDNTIRCYDPNTGTWSVETPLNTGPSPRTTGGEIIGTGIYLYGGRISASGTVNDCWFYNFLDKLWYACKPATTNTAYSDIVLLGDRIFTFDGWISSTERTTSGIFELS